MDTQKKIRNLLIPIGLIIAFVIANRAWGNYLELSERFISWITSGLLFLFYLEFGVAISKEFEYPAFISHSFKRASLWYLMIVLYIFVDDQFFAPNPLWNTHWYIWSFTIMANFALVNVICRILSRFR